MYLEAVKDICQLDMPSCTFSHARGVLKNI